MKGGCSLIKIVAIGDNGVDKYINLKRFFPGGNALNVAVFAHRYGATTAYIGCIGNDRAGKNIYNSLEKEGINVSHIKVVNAPNRYAIVKLIDGERTFLSEGNVETNKMLKLNMEDFDFIKQFHLVHTSVFSYIEEMLPELKKMGKNISFDYSDNFEPDYLNKTLPYVDFAFFSGNKIKLSKIKLFQKKVSSKGPKIVLVTRGFKGAILYYNGRYLMQPAIKTSVLDTLGGGDSFIASFLVNFLNKESIKKCLKNAAMEASKTCTYYGAFGYGLDYK